MLNQETDADLRRAADDHRDDAPGLAVPEPRPPSAARLLEMTARDTARWRSEAEAEAAEIVASARHEADTLLRTAQREAASMVEAARADAARTGEEARVAADGVRADSDRRRAEAEAEVARIQQLASEHSARLRQHLADVLGRLDA